MTIATLPITFYDNCMTDYFISMLIAKLQMAASPVIALVPVPG